MRIGAAHTLWALLLPARDHDQFRGAGGRGGSVSVAVEVLDVEAGEIEGRAEVNSTVLPLG
jgi:hypothetical protein